MAPSATARILSPDGQPDPEFVGRVTEQDNLLQMLAPSEAGTPVRATEPVVTLSAVSGLGGIGKSALARTVAQIAAARGWFPGGVVWLDLQGFDPDPTAQIQPAQLWTALLTALGVAEDRVPRAEAARATAYHSLLDELAVQDRRVLLIFDNVAVADQVRPLLPVAGSAATRHRILLTSRQTLAELPARLVNLDVLDADVATQLLTRTLTIRRTGEHRLADDPEGVGRLIGLCAGLPLAVVVVGAILAAEPSLLIAELADELEDTGRRLAGLTYGPGLAVRTAFEVSYHRLDDDHRTVFACFSVVPGPDAALPMIAAVAELPLAQTRAAVRHLQIVHLLESVPSARGQRWRMHDLVRLYAREQLSEQHAADAFVRALGCYKHMIDLAWKRLAKNVDGVGGKGFPTHQAALGWVRAEQVGLVDAVVRSSARHALPAVLLAADLMPCLQRVHAVDDYVRVGEAAVRLAADASVPERVGAVAQGNLGMALVVAERFDDAVQALSLAGDLMQRAGDAHDAAVTRMNLGVLLNQMQRFAEARTVMADLSTTFHDLGDKTNEASALLNMGNTLLWLGEFEDALSTFESARLLFEDLQDPHGSGQVWGGIGSVHWQRRELAEAINAYRRACAAHENSGDQHSNAQAHRDLGDVLVISGQSATAITAYLQAAALYAAVNDHENAARVGAKVAMVLAGAPNVTTP